MRFRARLDGSVYIDVSDRSHRAKSTSWKELPGWEGESSCRSLALNEATRVLCIPSAVAEEAHYVGSGLRR